MISGRYRYKLNGEIVPVEESWSVSGANGDRQRVESIRTAGDVALAVTAELEGGRVRCCEIEWLSGDAPPVTAGYQRTPSGLSWRRTMGESVSEGLVEGEVFLYPLMRVFTGSVITALYAAGGEGLVLVPDISSSEEAQLLLPDTSSRRVVCEGKDTLDGHPDISCQRWRFIGGQYDNSAAFWLDQSGNMLRYQWRQSDKQLWQVDRELSG
jgi:hypothetical protein